MADKFISPFLKVVLCHNQAVGYKNHAFSLICILQHVISGLNLLFCQRNLNIRIRINSDIGIQFMIQYQCIRFLGFFFVCILRLFFTAYILGAHADDGLIGLDAFDDVLVLIAGGSGFDASIHQHGGYLIALCGNYGKHNLAILRFSGAVGNVCSVYGYGRSLIGLEGDNILSYVFPILSLGSFILGDLLVCNGDHRILCYVGNPVFVLISGAGNVRLIRSHILDLIVLIGNYGKGIGIILLYILIIRRNCILSHRRSVCLDRAVNRCLGIKCNPVKYVLFLGLRFSGIFCFLVLNRLIFLRFLLILSLAFRLRLLHRYSTGLIAELRRHILLIFLLGLVILLLILRSFLCCLTLRFRLGRFFRCLTLRLRLSRFFRRLTLGLRLSRFFRCLTLRLRLGCRFRRLAFCFLLSRRCFCRLTFCFRFCGRLCLGLRHFS